MSAYDLFHWRENGATGSIQRLFAADDVEALRDACRAATAFGGAVWHGSRMVGTVPGAHVLQTAAR